MTEGKKTSCEECDKCGKCPMCGMGYGKSGKYWMKHHGHKNAGGCGGFYFLGFIGSAVFFMQQVSEFWPGVLALLKALVWPAFMVYEVFKFLIK